MKMPTASLVLFGAALLPAQARSRHASNARPTSRKVTMKAPRKRRLSINIGEEHAKHFEDHEDKCGVSKLDEIMTKYGENPDELKKKLLEQCEKCNKEVADILEEEAKLKEELEEKKAKYCDGGDQEKCEKYMAALDAFKDIEGVIQHLGQKVCENIEGTRDTEETELVAAGVSPTTTTTSTTTTTTTTTSTSIVEKEHRAHLDKFVEKCGDGEGSKMNEIMTKYDGEELQEKLLEQCEKCNKEVADIVEEEAKLKEELEGKVEDHCGDGGDQEKCDRYTVALNDLVGIIDGTGDLERITDLERTICEASDAAEDTEETELEAAGISPTTTTTFSTTTTTTTTSTTSTINAQKTIDEARKALDEAKKKLEAAEKEAAEAKDEVDEIQEKIDEEIEDTKDWLLLREATLTTNQEECVAASKALTAYVEKNNLYNPDSNDYKELMDEQKKKCDSALQTEKEIYDLKHKVGKLKEDLAKRTAEWEEAEQDMSDARADVAAKQVNLDKANAGVQRRARAAKKNLRAA